MFAVLTEFFTVFLSSASKCGNGIPGHHLSVILPFSTMYLASDSTIKVTQKKIKRLWEKVFPEKKILLKYSRTDCSGQFK
jgi:hypothetical protein